MKEQDFVPHLKSAAISVLGSVSGGDQIAATKSSVSLEYLIRFAMDVNIVGMANGEIMFREINGLKDSLTTLAGTNEDGAEAESSEADIADIFSKEDIRQKDAIRQESEPVMIRQNNPANEFGNGGIGDSGNNDNGNASLKAAIRQTAILERIRQTGNCRIKDIQEILPQCSERTIRYDLQDLLEKNLVERVGSGGPSVFYRLRPGADVIPG